MGISKQIGKNTLGDSDKMRVDLRTYNRSTHNLSRAWRSTMGVGTLVPCFKEVALPGDTFDIELAQKVMTHPTVGPLFGSYKLQVDLFTCPIRLYNAMLHNNALGVGLDMAKVKIPTIEFKANGMKAHTELNGYAGNRNISGSSIIAYMGINNLTMQNNDDAQIYNGLPFLMYQDIFKNYYANKQEKNYYWLSRNTKTAPLIISSSVIDSKNIMTAALITANIPYSYTNVYAFSNSAGLYLDDKQINDLFLITGNTTETTFTLKEGKSVEWKGGNQTQTNVTINTIISLASEPLANIDTVREKILAGGKSQINIANLGSTYLANLTASNPKNSRFYAYSANYGLLIKTHSSDLFNNWVSSEWVDGANGISEITAVDTSSGKLNLDSLNLAQKVYNMLNRIAVSGGTYKDWIETVYTADGYGHVETPIYEGGLSAEIQFEEVVSTALSEEQPLGTLGGRGVGQNSKGGKLHIKVEEPSYIIGIVSITPRVDYSQGTEWDMTELKTLNDLHKPALDGIGYQDLLAKQAAGWVKGNVAIGKTVAWINYMTSYNRACGNFAAGESEDFMVLNRIYEEKTYTAEGTNLNITTYINPANYINQFAEKSLTAQDFWVQLGFKVDARRVMSAKQIPNI